MADLTLTESGGSSSFRLWCERYQGKSPHQRWQAVGLRIFRAQMKPSGEQLAGFSINIEPFAKFARKRDLLSGRVVVPGKPMASQVQIPFEGVILQEHSAPISCPTPNFCKRLHNDRTTSTNTVSSDSCELSRRCVRNASILHSLSRRGQGKHSPVANPPTGRIRFFNTRDISRASSC